MLVLTTRPNEKINLPETRTVIEVVAIQSGAVRLGISAPEEVRILREGVQDRVAEWGPVDIVADEAPTLSSLKRLLDKRLEIAREGVDEVREALRTGRDEDARIILEKIDEDLHLLRRRIRKEIDKAELLSVGI